MSDLQQQLRNHWYEQSQYGEKEINFFDNHAMAQASQKNKRFFKPDEQSQAHVTSFFGAVKNVAKHSVYRAIHDVHHAYLGTENWFRRRGEPDADYQQVQNTKENQNVDNTKVPIMPRSRTLSSRVHQSWYNRKKDYRTFINNTYNQHKAPVHRNRANTLGKYMPQFSSKRMQQGAYMYFNEVYPTLLTDASSGIHLKNIWKRTFKPSTEDINTLMKIRSAIPDYQHLQDNISSGDKYLAKHDLYSPTFDGVLKNEKIKVRNQEFTESSTPDKQAVKKLKDSHSNLNKNLHDYHTARKNYLAFAKSHNQRQQYKQQQEQHREEYMSHPLKSSISSEAQTSTSNMSASSVATSATSSSIDVNSIVDSITNAALIRDEQSIRASATSAINNTSSATPKSSSSVIVSNHSSMDSSAMFSAVQSAKAAQKYYAQHPTSQVQSVKSTSQSAQPLNVRIAQVKARIKNITAQLAQLNSKIRQLKNSTTSSNSTSQAQSATSQSSVVSNASNVVSTKASSAIASKPSSVASQSSAVKRVGNRMSRDDLVQFRSGLPRNATRQKRLATYLINNSGLHSIHDLQRKAKVPKAVIVSFEKKGVLTKIKPNNHVNDKPAPGQESNQPPEDINKLSKREPSNVSKGIHSYNDMSKQDKHNYKNMMNTYSKRQWLKSKILPSQKGKKAANTKKNMNTQAKNIKESFGKLSKGAQVYVRNFSKHNNKAFRNAAYRIHKHMQPNSKSSRHRKMGYVDTSYLKNIPKKDRLNYSKAVAALSRRNYYKNNKNSRKKYSKKQRISGVSRNSGLLKKYEKRITKDEQKQLRKIATHPRLLSKFGWAAGKYNGQHSSSHKQTHSRSMATSQNHKASQTNSQSASASTSSAPNLDSAKQRAMKRRKQSQTSDKKVNNSNTRKQTKRSQKSTTVHPTKPKNSVSRKRSSQSIQ